MFSTMLTLMKLFQRICSRHCCDHAWQCASGRCSGAWSIPPRFRVEHDGRDGYDLPNVMNELALILR